MRHTSDGSRVLPFPCLNHCGRAPRPGSRFCSDDCFDGARASAANPLERDYLEQLEREAEQVAGPFVPTHWVHVYRPFERDLPAMVLDGGRRHFNTRQRKHEDLRVRTETGEQFVPWYCVRKMGGGALVG